MRNQPKSYSSSTYQHRQQFSPYARLSSSIFANILKMKTVRFAAAAVLFAVIVSAAPGLDHNPSVPATVKPDAAPVVPSSDFCRCLSGFGTPCIPTTRCILGGNSCTGPC
ncbi:hypothetical protein GQ42DRAFT_158817 [Ramicandelaber brevisporus]|nr:hypothetical protein GQ42DRAFT_158817 [Ramicandelaber brevisporus]